MYFNIPCTVAGRRLKVDLHGSQLGWVGWIVGHHPMKRTQEKGAD